MLYKTYVRTYIHTLLTLLITSTSTLFAGADFVRPSLFHSRGGVCNMFWALCRRHAAVVVLLSLCALLLCIRPSLCFITKDPVDPSLIWPT
jgi:hypothetical protein